MPLLSSPRKLNPRHCYGSPGAVLLVLCCSLLLRPGIAVAQSPASAGASVLAGRVTNARTNAPMARVLVEADGQVVFTDAEGRFQLTDAGSIGSVQFTKPGFALSPEQRDSNSISVVPSKAPAPLEVSLWPEAILAGTVTSAEGDPLPRVAVIAQRYSVQNGVHQVLQTGFAFTGPHGNFRLPVPAGDYVVQTRYAPPDFARPLALLPAQTPTRTANEGTGTLHVASGQELHIDLHPQLAPVVHLLLPIEGSETFRPPAITVTTSDGTTYQPPRRTTQRGLTLDLPAGTCQLSAHLAAPDGDRIGELSLTVPDHDATALPLHLEAAPSVPVLVTVDAAPPGSASSVASGVPSASSLNLQLEPLSPASQAGAESPTRTSNRGLAGTVFSAAPGSYRLEGGEGSAWTIESASLGDLDLLRAPLVLGTGTAAEPIRIVVSRSTGTITGVTRIGGVPAACWIVFVPDAAALPRFFIRRSNTDGRFTIGSLPLRSYRVLATPLLSSADLADPAILDQFHTFLQRVSITSSSSAALDLNAVPVRELYP